MLMRGAGYISQGTNNQDAMNVAAYNEVDEIGLMDFLGAGLRPKALGHWVLPVLRVACDG